MEKKMDDSTLNEMLFKIIILGDAGRLLIFKIYLILFKAVGKSCIMNKFIRDEFHEDYSVTIGVEFSSKKIEIDPNVKLTLQIWDTVKIKRIYLYNTHKAGQESFRSIVKSFYRNAAGAFLVYDISNAESFHKLDFWIKEMKENARQNMVLILVGNKNDKENERQISKEEGINYMKKNGISLFFETSAKTGENIELVC